MNERPTPHTRPTGARQRVVLAHRRGARMVRTRVEVQEQTQVGDALVRGLVRAQLGLALRLSVVVVCAVGGILVLTAADGGREELAARGITTAPDPLLA